MACWHDHSYTLVLSIDDPSLIPLPAPASFSMHAASMNERDRAVRSMNAIELSLPRGTTLLCRIRGFQRCNHTCEVQDVTTHPTPRSSCTPREGTHKWESASLSHPSRVNTFVVVRTLYLSRCSHALQ
ncbi:unnamed protein product, partial [Ectocarpus sp. 12 AP-2014]